jgi:hypothetical protein
MKRIYFFDFGKGRLVRRLTAGDRWAELRSRVIDMEEATAQAGGALQWFNDGQIQVPENDL